MKIKIAILALGLCAAGMQMRTYAQTNNLKPLQSDQTVHKAGLDTVANAGSVAQFIQLPGYYDVLTIQTGVTKLTGTIAGGSSVKLFGSVDGIKYDLVSAATDTLAVGNVTGLQVKTWRITPSYFQYYKAVYKTPTSTQTSTINTMALWRKQ